MTFEDQLQQRLGAVWSGVQQTVVDEATDEWRISGLVRGMGRHFEFVAIMVAACPLLTLSRWMIEKIDFF